MINRPESSVEHTLHADDRRAPSTPHPDGALRSPLRLLVVAAAVSLLGLYYGYPNAVPDLRADQANDSFVYIRLAKALLVGEGFQTRHWQPGFPVMLSGALALVGLEFYRLKFMMITLAIATALASVRLFRRAGYVDAAVILGLLLAATPLYFDYGHRLMSEIPFIAWSLLALVALFDLHVAPTPRREMVAGVVLAIAGSAAVLLRGNGLALVPAIGVALVTTGRATLGRRRWLLAALLAIVVTFAAWMTWSTVHTFHGIHNVTYLQELRTSDIGALWASGGNDATVPHAAPRDYLTRIYQNVAWYQIYNADALVWPYAQRLAEVQARGVGLALASLALVPALVGSITVARRFPPAIAWLLSSVLLAIVYPTGGAARMLLPSVPVLILVFYAGLESLFGRRIALGWATCALWANIFICAAQADFQSRHPYFDEPYFGGGESTVNAMSLIRDDLPGLTSPTDVVISEYYDVISALTDRRAAPPSAFAQYLAEGPILILENRSHVIDVPAGYSRQTVAERGDVRLSRLAQNR
jgi:hypothetical protein